MNTPDKHAAATPHGHATVSPYLVVESVEQEIKFLKGTFNAEILEQIPNKEGKITHAEARIGDSVIMMGRGASGNTSTGCMIYVYVANVDEVYKNAMNHGAASINEPEDRYYGSRECGVIDIHGIQWWIATHIEKLSPEELKKRAAEHHG